MRQLSGLTVRLDYLAQNIKQIKNYSSAEIIMMVKANAYGHGLIDITRFAHNDLKLNCFGVATLGEAIKIKKELIDFTGEIYVFSESNLKNYDNLHFCKNQAIYPIIWNLNDLDIAIKNNLPLILKFNTGMNRLGLEINDLDLIRNKIQQSGRSIKHLMTHFSSANLSFKTGDRTDQQYNSFLEIKKYFLDSRIEIQASSVSNSAAIEQKIGTDETHIRPGIMLYGPSGMRQSKSYQGKLISVLESEILHLFKASKGTPIGYGGHILDEDAQIAYLPLGYGDGLSYHLSGLELDLGFCQAKVLGRVNMDMMALKIPLHQTLDLNEKLILWDNKQNFDNWCNHLKTISYEVLCSISHRLPRFYRLQ